MRRIREIGTTFGLFWVWIMVLALACTASAQITITVPDVFKVKKSKKETARTDQPPVSTQAATTTAQPQVSETPQQESLWVKTMVENVNEVRKEVEEFDPKTKVSLVIGYNYDYLLRAVSPKARTAWLKDTNALDTVRKTPNNRLDAALDQLAAAAAKKIPTYRARLDEFKVRNPAEERLMKSILTKIANYKILSGGMFSTNFSIAKNEFGLPVRRFKTGVFHIKDTTDDHPYCYLTYINIIQDYSGGGTYGASYAEFIKDELIGCPVGS